MCLKKKNILTGLLISIIILIGFFIRSYNISKVSHVDEKNIINFAIQIADDKHHIKWYNWPAQSLIRINGVIFNISSFILNRNEPIKLTTKQLYDKNSTSYNTMAHYTTVLFALVSIFLIFLIGKNIHNIYTGLLGSFFLAINYLHGVHSRFATPDVPITFAFLLNILLAIKICQLSCTQDKQTTKKKLLLYGLAGIVLGFAIATKYTGILAITPIILASLFIFSKKRNWNIKKIVTEFYQILNWSLLMTIIGTGISHTLFNPYFFQDIQLVINSLIIEANPNRLGVDWANADHKFLLNLVYYLKSSLTWNGTIISIVAFTTMLLSFLGIKNKKWQPIIGINVFFLIILIGLSILGLHWSRWAVPFSPIISLMGALGLITIFEYILKKIKYKKIAFICYCLILIIIVLPQILISLVTGYSLDAKNTGEKLSEYINTNLPLGSKIIADNYNLKIDENKYILEKKNTSLNFYNKTFADYKASGVDYLVIKPKRLAYAKQQPKVYQYIIDFHKALDSNSELLISYQSKLGLLNHKNDYGVYKWLIKNDLKKIFNIHTGANLALYKIK